MAKSKVNPESKFYRVFKTVPGNEGSVKSYVKFYPTAEAAAKDQNKRLEPEVFESHKVTK